MAHITVEIDDAVLAQLQVIAAHRQTTVEAMAAGMLGRMAAGGLPDRDRMSSSTKALFDYLVGRTNWEATQERLGIDDITQTQMLRQAGFTPPQS